MKNLFSYITRFMLVTLLFVAFTSAATSADPSDEAKNKESCTGTCNTCPGKASALMELADTTKVLLSVAAIESSDVVKQIRLTISELEGVEVCVPFREEGWVWVAFDDSKLVSAKLQEKLAGLGLKDVAELHVVPALKTLPKNHERVAIYAMIPISAKSQNVALGSVAGLSGVLDFVYDSAYHVLLVDFDTSKTDGQKLKQGIVAAGYAAGLPGEELQQPAQY